MVTNRARHEIIWMAPKKFQMLLRRRAQLTFSMRVQAFREPLRGELPHIKSSWMTGPTRSFEIPSFSHIDFGEIRLSSKSSSWIWSVISGVVTVLYRSGRGATQVEKSPRLNWSIQVLTVAYDGACTPKVSVRMARIFFGNLPWRKKKLDDSPRLDVVEITPFAWNASFQPL